MQFTEKELAFLRIVCGSEHRHVTQDYVCERLVADEVITPDEFKQIKKKLLYSGVIGVVYGNITIEDESVINQVLET